MYEELLKKLRSNQELRRKHNCYYPLNGSEIDECSAAIADLIIRIAALQVESEEKDKEIERWKAEAKQWRTLRADADRIREGMMSKELDLISKNIKLESALSRVEAERDAAYEHICDQCDILPCLEEGCNWWRCAQGVE